MSKRKRVTASVPPKKEEVLPTISEKDVSALYGDDKRWAKARGYYIGGAIYNTVRQVTDLEAHIRV